jgi:hypothetical protein
LGLPRDHRRARPRRPSMRTQRVSEPSFSCPLASADRGLFYSASLFTTYLPLPLMRTSPHVHPACFPASQPQSPSVSHREHEAGLNIPKQHEKLPGDTPSEIKGNAHIAYAFRCQAGTCKAILRRRTRMRAHGHRPLECRTCRGSFCADISRAEGCLHFQNYGDA